ncbi:MAG TPA: ABC transporter permease [Rhizobiaceae bacterium]|nr:ABC transporter permease [Rhizobiaceae bacterium]
MSAAGLRNEALAACVLLVLMVLASIVIAGANPFGVIGGIVERALFTRAGLLEAVLRTIPLTIMGLGIALAFRARVFNIGMDGQLIAGSVLAVALAPLLPANPVGLVLFLVAGIAGGAVWGGIAGLIKARFGGNEIIATIMLNYVAIQLLSWLMRGPMQETMKIIPRSDQIDRALRLPILFDGTRVHLGLVIAVAAVVFIALLAGRSRFGFKLDVVGANEHAARYAGIDPRWIAGIVLAFSGALAGLAGVVEISGLYGRLQEGFAPGFGIAAIAVALVARLNPLLVPLSAFLFSLLYVGLGALARNGVVPFPIINIIEGVIILVFLAGSVALNRRKPVAETLTDE